MELFLSKLIIQLEQEGFAENKTLGNLITAIAYLCLKKQSNEGLEDKIEKLQLLVTLMIKKQDLFSKEMGKLGKLFKNSEAQTESEFNKIEKQIVTSMEELNLDNSNLWIYMEILRNAVFLEKKWETKEALLEIITQIFSLRIFEQNHATNQITQ